MSTAVLLTAALFVAPAFSAQQDESCRKVYLTDQQDSEQFIYVCDSENTAEAVVTDDIAQFLSWAKRIDPETQKQETDKDLGEVTQADQKQDPTINWAKIGAAGRPVGEQGGNIDTPSGTNTQSHVINWAKMGAAGQPVAEDDSRIDAPASSNQSHMINWAKMGGTGRPVESEDHQIDAPKSSQNGSSMINWAKIGGTGYPVEGHDRDSDSSNSSFDNADQIPTREKVELNSNPYRPGTRTNPLTQKY
jgi:hypothetical protein